MKELENKVAIVSGAASGIGREIAILYAKEGAKVVIGDIDESGGQEVVLMIEKSAGEAMFVKCDSSKPEDNELLVKKTVERFSALHIACNNAE